MLNNDKLAERFYGGTVYQGFLSPTSYHRWHSPVSGTILKTELVHGAYYSGPVVNEPGFTAIVESQAYFCQVAARGIVYIQADNPDIGLMAFVAVGMLEVSSIEFTVKTGDRVKKGDEIGMFHFGGSTHCLVFQPGVNLKFDFRGQTPGTHRELFNIPVRSKIAVLAKQNELN
jgi:phosphatidylserine decarboxylase